MPSSLLRGWLEDDEVTDNIILYRASIMRFVHEDPRTLQKCIKRVLLDLGLASYVPVQVAGTCSEAYSCGCHWLLLQEKLAS